MELMQAHHQWMHRPNDERFLNLDVMFNEANVQMNHSASKTVSSRALSFRPSETAKDKQGLYVVGPSGNEYSLTHHSFNQACQRVNAPPDFLRDHPAAMTADILNFRYTFKREIEDVGILLHKNGVAQIRAITGPNYGRIFDAPVIDRVRKLFGNGEHGNGSRWHVPGEFNVQAPITKENTTLYRGDRDMWVFLADGKNSIEIPNRRFGESGMLQRGFFCWNSEVGQRSFGVATFLYDFMCANHIIWSAAEFTEKRLRHTASAPDRWLEEIMPALEVYANGSSKGITDAITLARSRKLEEKLDEFLANRFSKGMVGPIKSVHQLEEGRPIETIWDVVTAATAYARNIPNIGDRVEVERTAGALLVAA